LSGIGLHGKIATQSLLQNHRAIEILIRKRTDAKGAENVHKKQPPVAPSNF